MSLWLRRAFGTTQKRFCILILLIFYPFEWLEIKLMLLATLTAVLYAIKYPRQKNTRAMPT